MKCTSAQAAKILRKLEDDIDSIVMNESQSRDFLASVGEDVESVRPAYSFSETQAKLDELEEKVRKVKHAINAFNSSTVVEGFGMTIDQLLVYLPQLSRRAAKLREMKNVLPKVREMSHSARVVNFVDYRYANYDIAEAEKAYIQVTDTLARAQTALDTVNNTVTFDLDV